MNEGVQRNHEKFPADFVFVFTPQEVKDMWSQFVTTSPRYRLPKYRPFNFTEYGILMAANVLHSPQAVKMSVFCSKSIYQNAGTFA